MLGTLVRRIAVNTLDTVIERGKGADVAPVRWAADTLDHVRVRVGLDRVERTAPLPAWTGAHPDRPMWESDRQKLRKHQIERGILPPEDQNTGAAASSTVEQAPDLDSAAIKIFYKRGCPYARAALDLLRERDYSFDAQDIKDDDATQSWLKIVTGKKVTPQIFIRGEAIGGYDELRELDASGELARRVRGEAAAEAASEDDGAPEEITVAELRERIAEGASPLLLDVRTRQEAAGGVLPGAVHIPLDELSDRMGELDTNGVWIAYCHAGVRSLTAVARLRDAGIRGAVSLRGGIAAWSGQGGEVVPLGQAPREARKKLPVLHPEASPFEAWAAADVLADEERLEGEALVERVKAVLDECRPLVQADGGDIELMDVQNDVVHLRLTGNCIGCPSSQATLKQGIERRLKARIPQLQGIASPQLV